MTVKSEITNHLGSFPASCFAIVEASDGPIDAVTVGRELGISSTISTAILNWLCQESYLVRADDLYSLPEENLEEMEIEA